MHVRTFGRTLVFGFVAALSYVAWMLATAPFVGANPAFFAWLLAALVLYAGGLAPRLALAPGYALIAGLLGGVVLVFSQTPLQAAAGAAVVIALLRGVLISNGPALRILFYEGALTALSLTLAYAFVQRGVLEVSFSIWVFFVVQSAAYLAPRVEAHGPSEESPDPFEKSRSQIEALLREPA